MRVAGAQGRDRSAGPVAARAGGDGPVSSAAIASATASDGGTGGNGQGLPVVLAAALGVITGAVAVVVGGLEPPRFWFVVLVLTWCVGTLAALVSPRPSLAFLALQAWVALNVVNGAVLYVVEGVTVIGPYDFSASVAGGMRLAAWTELGLVAGWTALRVLRPARPLLRLRGLPAPTAPFASSGRSSGSLPKGGPGEPAPAGATVVVSAGRLDRLSVGLLVAGAVSLLAYAVLSGAGVGALNVLTSDNVYGELSRAADGVVIKYLKVLTGLAGAAMLVATLRLTLGGGRRSLAGLGVPVVVLGVAGVLLVSSGGRSWLLVPAVACALVWVKTSRSRWARRPRQVAVLGGLALFAVAALVGGLRTQVGDKTVDPEGFVAKELRGGIFPTTAGLTGSVPAQQPYLGGGSFLDAVTLVAPRALWPDKPESALRIVHDAFMPTDIGASFGFQGELYANGGLPLVFAGCVAFAALLEWCWLRFSEARSLGATLWCAAAVPVLVQVFSRDYAATGLAAQAGLLLGVGIAAWQLGARRRRRLPLPAAAPGPRSPAGGSTSSIVPVRP